MHALKPLKVGLLHKMFQARSRCFFGVEALLVTDFTGGRLGTEIGMWSFLAEQLPGMVIDEAIPKSRGELLVRGYAFPPKRPATTCPIHVRVGDVEKSLSVIGDRVWDGDVQSPPEPFDRMELTWDRAFGGEGFAKNPTGRGFAEIALEDGRRVRPLPNVEWEGRLIRSPKERPEPAGLMPIDFSWPQRIGKAGTYDEKWVKERFPGYADDLDWSMFNAAPPDQWTKGHWAPDTEFEFTNMHPDEARVSGALPGYLGRAFVVFGKTVAAGQKWQEVKLVLDTLWFFPHAKKVVLGFTGSVEVREDDGSDVDWVVVAAEHASRPKPLEHYQRVMAEREGFEPDAVAARFRDSELLPEGVDSALDEAAKYAPSVTPEQVLRRNQLRGAIEDWEVSRQRCVDAGVDPDEYLGPCPYDPAELDGPSEVPDIEQAITIALEQKAKADEKVKQAEADRDEMEARFREIVEEAGIDFDAAMADSSAAPPGPPIQWASVALRRSRDTALAFRDMGHPQPQLEAQCEDPAFAAQLAELERMQIEAYRTSAHLGERSLAGVPDPDTLEALRAWLEGQLAGSRDLSGKDLTGADLSGLDLSGASFRGAFLEHANLEGTICAGTDFEKAVLTRTRWAGARLEGTKLAGANLGRASLVGCTVASPIDVSDAILDDAALGGLSLRGARASGLSLTTADLSGVDFSGADLEGCTFEECLLDGASFAGATLDGADFSKCVLTGLDFTGASMRATTFLECRATGCDFTAARATGLKLLLESVLDDCDFTGCALENAYLRGSSLERARFDGATLDFADLCGCKLAGARFVGARGRAVRLTRADLDGADLSHADLMFAWLDKASIPGARFTGANLFTTDFGLVASDGDNDLTGANTKRVKSEPRRKKPQAGPGDGGGE